MHNDLIRAGFTVSILTTILLAGWYPLKKKKPTNAHVDAGISDSLATGIFLGAAMLHMLPEASHMFNQLGYTYPFALLITGSVFLIFLWFEHLGKELYGHHEHSHVDQHSASSTPFALVAWVMLSFHSLVLGSVLGFAHDLAFMIMIYLAIISHKWAESFAIAVQLSKSKLKASTQKGLFLFFALMSPLGAFIGWYWGSEVSLNSLFNPVLIATSAGTFLYLGTLHGLERCVMVARCCNLRDFSFVILGFLFMGLVAAYL
jgi:zinc transporter ZupT